MKKYALIMAIVLVLIGNIYAVSALCYPGFTDNICVYSNSEMTEYSYGPSYTAEPGGSFHLPLYVTNEGTTNYYVFTGCQLRDLNNNPVTGMVRIIDNSVVRAGETGYFDNAACPVPSTLPYGVYKVLISVGVGKVGVPNSGVGLPPDGEGAICDERGYCDIGAYVFPAGFDSYDDVIMVPVWECYEEDSPPSYQCNCDSANSCKACPSGSLVSDKELRNKILAADDRSFLKYAHIMFYPVSTENGNIPVITNTLPDGNHLITATLAAGECEAAWRQRLYGDPHTGDRRLTVVDAKDAGCGGEGFGCSKDPRETYDIGSSGHDRLCSSPRNLNFWDILASYAAISDQPVLPRDPPRAIAHELGHCLLLGHGNGLDDNNDGFFDLCDPLGNPDKDWPQEDHDFGFLGQPNLMNYVPNADVLTSLQVEQARAAALVAPGAMMVNAIPSIGNIKLSTRMLIPGGTTTVDATELPPNDLADISLGDKWIGSGQTDSAGRLHLDVVIPSSATEGLHPLLVEFKDVPDYAVALLLVYGDPQTPLTHVEITPVPSSYDWNNGPVTLTLSSTGVRGGADIAMIHYSASGAQTITPTTVQGAVASLNLNVEGVTTVTYYAEDSSGNQESHQTITIKIDALAPSITGLAVTEPNNQGWNNEDVDVKFTCEDSISGISSCPGSVILTTEGKDQSVSGEALDFAWNSATVTVEGIDIDKTVPIQTLPSPIAATATGVNGAIVTYPYTAKDMLSGLVSSACSPVSGSTFPLGTTTVTCSAIDKADNVATGTFKVAVTYSWSGYLSPITADSRSTFKSGSVIPVKFKLTGASAGITNAVANLYYAPVLSGTVGSYVGAESVNSKGDVFRYDPTARQYIYNWNTKSLKKGMYQLKIDLGDGVARTVQINLS